MLIGIGAALDDGQHPLAERPHRGAGRIGRADVLDGVVQERRDRLVLIRPVLVLVRDGAGPQQVGQVWDIGPLPNA